MKLVMFTSQLDVSARLILNVMDLPYAKTRAVESRLALLTRSPPVTRRAVVIRWSKVCHIYLLLGSE